MSGLGGGWVGGGGGGKERGRAGACLALWRSCMCVRIVWGCLFVNGYGSSSSWSRQIGKPTIAPLTC